MKYTIRHNFRDIFLGGSYYYISSFFKKFHAALQIKFPEHSFDIINDNTYEGMGNGGIYSCMNLSIINPDNNKYILISFWDDWKYHFYQHMGWQPHKMEQFFYCGSFNFVDYFNFKHNNTYNKDIGHPKDILKTYKSFFYGPYFDSHHEELESIYNNRLSNTNLIDKLQFRGFMWDHRKNMTSSLPQEDFLIIDKNINHQSINYLDFLRELSLFKCSLSLPGNTNICNRDMECFAIGVPIIRPALDNILSDPLWPDFHYLCFYHAPKYWDGNCWYYSYKDLQEHLIYYWNKIKNNNELLSFVADNAYKWYKKNSSVDHNINYILSHLSLKDLDHDNN